MWKSDTSTPDPSVLNSLYRYSCLPTDILSPSYRSGHRPTTDIPFSELTPQVRVTLQIEPFSVYKSKPKFLNFLLKIEH